ncbi:MAG: hypothetical protein KGI91_06580 [Burkholderiales bacterium]|nr:hypothetical protein [Burkholderiales bacterium]MDE2431316.1 hypothetical protein [Burkholderiales bacterium]
MGRETLLTILVILLGGLAAQPLALWPRHPLPDEAPRIAERRAWLRLWLPVVPALLVAAWLFGWALREPDPVHDRFDHGMLVMACLPFAVIVLRAVLRATWVLLSEPADLPICTAGLLQPRIVFSPFLARALDEGQIRAAWEHEQAHVRHRDPLRIWLAQIATDLQWPWPWARDRFIAWLEILECARDDEARSRGASGVDLAAAILATVRRSAEARRPHEALWPTTADAALIGDVQLLQSRIVRLLSPMPEIAGTQVHGARQDLMAAAGLAALLAIACILGAVYGERILHPLLLWTWTV